MQNTKQAIAAAVYKKVVRHEGEDEKFKKAYASWAFRLPGLIMQSGLAQAISFLQHKCEGKESSEKDKKGAKALLSDLDDLPGLPSGSLSKWVFSAPAEVYLFGTDRTQEALTYFKHFSSSVLKVKLDSDSQ